jgi:hypothetical protein
MYLNTNLAERYRNIKRVYYCRISSENRIHFEPEYIEFYELDTQQFYNLLSRTKYQNPIYKAPTFWKGGDAVIIQYGSGEKEELSISYYGSFFRIKGEPGVYVFSNNRDAKVWQDLFEQLRQKYRSQIEKDPNSIPTSY